MGRSRSLIESARNLAAMGFVSLAEGRLNQAGLAETDPERMRILAQAHARGAELLDRLADFCGDQDLPNSPCYRDWAEDHRRQAVDLRQRLAG